MISIASLQQNYLITKYTLHNRIDKPWTDYPIYLTMILPITCTCLYTQPYSIYSYIDFYLDVFIDVNNMNHTQVFFVQKSLAKSHERSMSVSVTSS